MLTLTNFEDLLEKIKNITTPYEYYSIKEIYEENKDQLTPEQQRIIEEEYKKKASVLNPKYYERKIKDGARIITIGVDLTNNGEISDINFEEFKKYISKGKEISKINKKHLSNIIPKDLLLSSKSIDEYIQEYTSKINKKHLSNKSIDEYIQEYIIDMKEDEIDINLLYLFRRKNYLLTPKGNKGFIHFRFFNRNLNFYEVENLKPGTVPFKYDEKEREVAKIDNGNEKEAGKIDKKNNIYDMPFIKKQTFEANVKGYLHVDYDEDNNTISRVATVTFVVENLIKNDKNFDYDYFLRNVEDFYIEWKDADNSNGKRIENDTENICKYKFIRKIQVEHKEEKETKEFVTFFDFLLLNIWNEIVYPVRENIREKIKTIKLSKEYLDPEIFIENIEKQQTFIIFRNSVIVLDKAPELENYDLEKIPDYFIEDIIDFLGGKYIDKKDIFVKNYIKEIKENAFKVEEDIAYENYNCVVIPLDIYNMKYFYQNIINLEEGELEFGLKWGISWSILLGDMVTTSATYFILYNNEIEEHLSKEKPPKELKKITQKAIFDFEFYYDVDIVNLRIFREAFENIKNTFKLNYYHKVLLDRLQLFSNYEIAEENKEITGLLIVLTLALIVLGILQFLGILHFI